MDLFSIFYDLVKQIPAGMVSTYGLLANALGDPIAARAVGVMLSQNPEPVIVPCHRVVSSDGSIGGFTHPNGISEKINLLEREGITVERGRIVNFKNMLFTDFRSDYPLQKLKEEQIELSKKVILQDHIDSYSVTGVDVSYLGNLAFMAFVKFNFSTGEILATETYIDTVSFPYIPTYFSYREGDLILKHAERDGILIIDGNGILHPSRLGIASYVGVKLDVATIGVAKSLLTGNVSDNRIYLDNTLIGIKLLKNYISPGHKISIESAYRIIKNLTKKGSPEPIKLAHNAAKNLRNEYCGGHCSGPF
ncbi:MAG: endonuclease V [Thermoplasmata archaeon]